MSTTRDDTHAVDVRPTTLGNEDGAYCPYFHHVIELIGRRWTGAILLVLSRGPSRFSRLRQHIPGLSDRLLSERISELEAEGIVERSQVNEQTVYQLTDRGNGLRPIIDAVESFVKTAACHEHLPGQPGHPGRRGDPPSA